MYHHNSDILLPMCVCVCWVCVCVCVVCVCWVCVCVCVVCIVLITSGFHNYEAIQNGEAGAGSWMDVESPESFVPSKFAHGGRQMDCPL